MFHIPYLPIFSSSIFLNGHAKDLCHSIGQHEGGSIALFDGENRSGGNMDEIG